MVKPPEIIRLTTFAAGYILVKQFQIPCKTGGLAGDINQPVHVIVDNLLKSLWMYTVTWRIQNNEVRFLADIIQNLQYIARNKFAIM